MTTYSKTSWHGRLATHYGPLYTGQTTSICQYVWAIAAGLVGVLAIIVGLSIVLVVPVGLLGAWLAFMITHGMYISPGNPLDGILFALIVMALIAVAILILRYVDSNRDSFDRVKAPSVVRDVYRSFKEKFCFAVEVAE